MLYKQGLYEEIISEEKEEENMQIEEYGQLAGILFTAWFAVRWFNELFIYSSDPQHIDDNNKARTKDNGMGVFKRIYTLLARSARKRIS